MCFSHYRKIYYKYLISNYNKVETLLCNKDELFYNFSPKKKFSTFYRKVITPIKFCITRKIFQCVVDISKIKNLKPDLYKLYINTSII
ncbi:hypothetical protein PFAG_04772 [Plasmodium falciparum Santa Lucia]|uniref:Uncharacterized protein n=1 Tax=Plasmodium falciparum Santa Lucia TaxID=478859 RepID=W7FZ48_PLAFA|nr:hypothetical protein PFAG_04772 [Plasmodium falciparum Santa Lucia]